MADDLGNFMKPSYGDYHRIRQSPGCHHRPGRQLFGCPAVWGFIFQTSNVDINEVKSHEITDNLWITGLLKIVEDSWIFAGWWLRMTSTQSPFAAQSNSLQSRAAWPLRVLLRGNLLSRHRHRCWHWHRLSWSQTQFDHVWPQWTCVPWLEDAWRCLKAVKTASVRHRRVSLSVSLSLSLSLSLPLPCQIQTCGHQTPHIRHGYSNSTATVSHVTFSALWNHVVSLCCSNERMLVGSVLGVV